MLPLIGQIGKLVDSRGCSVLCTEQISGQDLQDEQDKSKKKILEILILSRRDFAFQERICYTKTQRAENVAQLLKGR